MSGNNESLHTALRESYKLSFEAGFGTKYNSAPSGSNLSKSFLFAALP